MKVDNFVRACLAAIVVLLALLLFRPSVHVNAAPPAQWLTMYGTSTDTTLASLNSAQAQGFQYVGSAGGVLIFKK